MTKADLTEKMASKMGSSKKDAEEALAAFLESVKETVAAGEDVTLVGFGTFYVSKRGAREGRNPRTGETIQIEAKRNVSFRAGKSLRDAVR